jgi:hypothetical protein
MVDDEVDETLLKQAVRYLLEHGASIDMNGEAEVPTFEMEGQSVSASQIVLKAYAAGMADEDQACAVGSSVTCVV